METKKILDSVFEGHNLTTLAWEGKVVWLATEISGVFGYSMPSRISSLVMSKWSDEFIEDEHFVVVRGASLRNLYEFAAPQWSAAKFLSRKARSVLLLTEPGVDLLILKTKKAVGKRLRYHLSSVVLPQFRRGMIEERPVAELEERYKQEISALKDKLIERDEQVICFAERLMESQSKLADANYTLGALGEAKAAVRHSAKLAGQSLQACKRTKKLRDVN